MQDITIFLSNLNIVELSCVYAIGALLCFLLGSAPTFAGILILALSLMSAFKVNASTNNIFLTILAFVITGVVLTLFAFIGSEKRKAGALGFSSIKEMYMVEQAAKNGAVSLGSDLQADHLSDSEEFNDHPTVVYTVAHPLFGTEGTAMPIMSYDLKQRFLETPPLKAHGWTMKQLIEVERNRLVEYCSWLRDSDDAFSLMKAIYPLLEDNVASGDPDAIEAFEGYLTTLRKVEGIED